MFDIFNSANVSITDSTFVDNSGTGISRHSFRANTGAVGIGYHNISIAFCPEQISLEVVQCNFINNAALAQASQFPDYIDFALFRTLFPGRGGAIGVFCNVSCHVTVKITDNRFEQNYASLFGGAIYFGTFGEGAPITHILERNSFTHNVANNGGGAIINIFASRIVLERPHSMLISDCYFDNNVGQTGGALFVYPTNLNCKYVLGGHRTLMSNLMLPHVATVSSTFTI